MKVYCLLALLLALFGGTKDAAAATIATTTTTTPSPPPQQPPPPPPPSPSTSSNSLPQGSGAGGNQPPARPPPPVWVQCLTSVPANLPDLFKLWCRDYEKIIPCLSTALYTEAAQNPLDQFLRLHFESEKLKTRSVQLCQNFQQVVDRAVCIQQNNASVEDWCHVLFARGQQYVFDVRTRQGNNGDDAPFKDLACQVTNDTTGCLGSAMTGCDVDVKRHLLAFYAFFTNETCLADPTAEYNVPPPPPPRPAHIVEICAERVREAHPPTPPAPNATPLDLLQHGVRQNCRTFEARYRCYDDELTKNTSRTFRDLWLQFTFNSSTAIPAQRIFCQKFNQGGLNNSLTAGCFTQTQPLLGQCDAQYDQVVGNVQYDFGQGKLDYAGVYKAACSASLRRAFCLRDAFKLCGETLAEAMLQSELDTLPDICLTLLPSNDGHGDNTAATTDDSLHEPAAETEPVAPGADSSSSPSSSTPGKGRESSVQTGAVSGQETHKGSDSLASCLGGSVLLVVVTGSLSLLLHA